MNFRSIRQTVRLPHVFSLAVLAVLVAAVLTSSPASANQIPRYELVLQDGQYQYVLDNSNDGSKTWAGHCDLGTPRNVTWNDIKDLEQQATPDCGELQRRVDANIILVFNTGTGTNANTGPTDSSSQGNESFPGFDGYRYRLVLQNFQYQYVLDYATNTRAWAGHCDLGQPDRVFWNDIKDLEQQATPDCGELQRRLDTNIEPTPPQVNTNCIRNGANDHTGVVSIVFFGSNEFTANGQDVFQVEFAIRGDCDALGHELIFENDQGAFRTVRYPAGARSLVITSNGDFQPDSTYTVRTSSVFIDATHVPGTQHTFTTA